MASTWRHKFLADGALLRKGKENLFAMAGK